MAPPVSGAIFCLAAVSRWAAWPAVVPLSALAGAFLILALYLIIARRDRTVSDTVAAAIDTDAGLGGELRSASWFAARDDRDAWSELHIDRAADRLRGVDWARLYPPVRAPRARFATSLMVCGTLALAIAFPARGSVGVSTSAPPRSEVRLAPDALDVLSPELQEQLEALLAAAETGTLAVNGTNATAAEMRDLLERLGQLRDRDALEKLARVMDADADPDAVQNMKELAQRLKHAAEMNASARELSAALENLARNLSEAARAEQADIELARAAASSDGPQPGNAAQTDAPGGIDQGTIQAVKEAQTAAGGAGVIMMSDQDAAAAVAAPGFGLGGSGAMSTDRQTADIERALRQELVEANKDSAGANVDGQVNRKTEQSQAAVVFTRSAAGKSDRSGAFGPPSVPERRRGDVQRYFLRKQ